MTAINIIQQTDRVAIISDTAYYDRNFVVVGFAPKAFALPGMPVVLAWRGMARAFALVGDTLAELGSADAILEEGESVVRDLIAENASHDDPIWRFELYIAAWSERQGKMVAMFMSNSPDNAAYGASYRWHPLPETITAGPFPTTEGLQRSGFRLTSRDPDDFDLHEHGRRLVEAQRLSRLPNIYAGGKLSHFIGGEANLHIVDRYGVQQSTLCTWAEDEVGKPIEPATLTTTGNVTGMNRQQRRAAERAARKQRAVA